MTSMNSSQESNSTAGEDEMKEVRDSDEPDEIQDLSQESSSETDEDEIKELKNSETLISSKRELPDRSLILFTLRWCRISLAGENRTTCFFCVFRCFVD